MLKKTEGQKGSYVAHNGQSFQNGMGLDRYYPLSGKKLLEEVLRHPDSPRLIPKLPSGDFFWLVKKVGEDDCLQLLELASLKQWQYLLDLEVWREDRLDTEEIFRWFRRLQSADPARFAKWLLRRGQALAYYYFFRSIQVEVMEEEDDFDPEDGFFSLDGLFYIRVLQNDWRETIEGILRTMADEDLLRYQAILSGLAGVLPAEFEEEMYRLRNTRLAEHGFLPYEEAVAVYAPLDHGALVRDGSKADIFFPIPDEEIGDLAPYSLLHYANSRNLLAITTSRIDDGRLLDRLRLQFAGLCNKVLSADRLRVNDLETLINVCRRVAGYLNLALEEGSGEDVRTSEIFLRNNPLASLFRVGFGLALKLKWETERWLKRSWFNRNGLGHDFWGDEWGDIISGLIEKRPRCFCGHKSGDRYKDFEHVSELESCREVLHRLIGLDNLFEFLAGSYPLDKELIMASDLTFHPFLLTLWARQLLALEPSFEGISLNQTRRFIHLLRSRDKGPPYRMPGFKELFIDHFTAFASELTPAASATLGNTLSLIWQGFRQEYDRVSEDSLDPRFSRYILITPLPQ